MSTASPVRRYGVREQTIGANDLDRAAEQIRLLGYAVVDGGYDTAALDALSQAFDTVLDETHRRFGLRRLADLGEENGVRAPLAYHDAFLDLACNTRILAVAEQLLGPFLLLNQQNGIVNPAGNRRYGQDLFHRDLPYQHFVSSRPIAINALFCVDPFTVANGATLVVPASHKEERFPSDDLVLATSTAIEAPRGAFLVLDAMTYHSGGANMTDRDRRAVNHLYSLPFLRQQIDLPALLGAPDRFGPSVRQLLGYTVAAPRSVEEYLLQREARSRS